MALGKEELLAAIAAAGTAGRTAYDQANQAIAAQQQEAVKAALASGIMGNAPQGAQAEVSRIVGQPYEQRTAQITQNRATMDDWYNRQTAMQGTYLDTALRLAELQAAGAGGSGGGGGGSGGRGRSDGEDEFDWYDNLKDTFGTADLGWGGIAQEAKALGLNSVDNPDMPRYMQTRQYATDAYGVPAAIAAEKFGPSEFGQTAMSGVGGVKTRSDLRQFKKDLKAADKDTKGNQSYWVKTATKSARQNVKRKKKK